MSSPNDDTVTIPRALFESLNVIAQRIENLPDEFRDAIEQSSALTLQAVDKAVGALQEQAVESVDAIIAAIPATIRRYAPDTSTATLSAILDEIAEHAMARMAALKVARAIIAPPPTEPGPGT
jgi:hypothetical protein